MLVHPAGLLCSLGCRAPNVTLVNESRCHYYTAYASIFSVPIHDFVCMIWESIFFLHGDSISRNLPLWSIGASQPLWPV